MTDWLYFGLGMLGYMLTAFIASIFIQLWTKKYGYYGAHTGDSILFSVIWPVILVVWVCSFVMKGWEWVLERLIGKY